MTYRKVLPSYLRSLIIQVKILSLFILSYELTAGVLEKKVEKQHNDDGDTAPSRILLEDIS